MSCDTFARGIVFAALAAVGWLPWALLATPVAGLSTARTVYLVTVTVLYISGLARRADRRMVTLVAATVVATGVALAANTTGELCIGLAATVGVARGAFLYRGAAARTVAREIALLGSGLLLARFLAASWPASTAPALWGFLLVQSLLFLGGGPARDRRKRRSDPFEEAYRHAVALLDMR